MSLTHNVGRREEDGERRDDGEEREAPQTQSVYDHGGELPVIALLCMFLAFTHGVRDKTQLFYDVLQASLIRYVVASVLRWRWLCHAHVIVLVVVTVVTAHFVVVVHSFDGAVAIRRWVDVPEVIVKVKDVSEQAAR